MCSVKTKLETFSYILYKLNTLYSDEEQNNDEIVKVSVELTNKKIMKLLYFLCIESTKTKKPYINSYGLFNIFNNFKAYPAGSVEEDVYLYRDIVPATIYVYDIGKFKSITLSELGNIEIHLGRSKISAIDLAFESLRNRFSKKIDTLKDVDKLVQISHNSPSWITAYHYSIDRVMKHSDIRDEYKKYTCAVKEALLSI